MFCHVTKGSQVWLLQMIFVEKRQSCLRKKNLKLAYLDNKFLQLTKI
jgi:hypothetical protein